MRPVWILDADGIDFYDNEVNNIYKNNVVKEFLGNEKKLGVSAPRGLGKTFLLKAKRNLFQQKSGVLCLPKNSMVDTVHTPRFFKSSLSFFENYDNWKTLWRISISISILKQLNERQHIDINTFNVFPTEISELFSLNINRAGEYFNHLISLDRKEINTIFYKCYTLDSALSNVDFSICMFIDRVDQALSGQVYFCDDKISKASIGPRNAKFWQYAQLSLADTAYDLFSYNKHIKIYFTIRSEAFVDAPHTSYNYQNIREYISDLRYSRKELYEMFKQYVEHESDENLYCPEKKLTNPLEAFVGIKEIECKYVDNTKESVFLYILRHTFLRPRDIMDICYHLYVADLKLYSDDQLKDQIRTIINRESQVILETYISSTEQFLLGIKREHIEYLCQLLNTNVMNEKYIKYVCNRLNENFDKSIATDANIIIENKDIPKNELDFWCQFNCENCEELHPFCQLFNIGLIGYIWRNRANVLSIRFNDMERGKLGTNHVLPKADYYFLHPCLASKAEHIRKSRLIGDDSFSFIKNILVSDKTEITDGKFRNFDKHISGALKAINDERVFLSSTCFDLKEDRKRIDDTMSELGFDVVRSDSTTFNADLKEVNSHDHCIDEMLKCNLMVFLLGKRYGGVYRGEKYQWAVKEIIEKSKGEIADPSISLIEYYVARKNKKKIFAYVDYNVYNERMTYKQNKYNSNEFKPFFADNVNVFKVIDFITNQNVNNWFRNYADLDNLEELIRIDFNFFN